MESMSREAGRRSFARSLAHLIKSHNRLPSFALLATLAQSVGEQSLPRSLALLLIPYSSIHSRARQRPCAR